MLNHNTLAIVLFILPVYQLMYYTIQLVTFRKEEKDPSRFPFGILMLFMLVFLSISTLHYLGYYRIYQYLYIIELPVLLSVLPTFHLYLFALLQADNSFYTKHPFVYYLPAFFVLLMNLISFGGMNDSQTGLFFADRLSYIPSQDIMVNTAVLVFFLGSVVFVLVQLSSSAYQFSRVVRKMNHAVQHDNTNLLHLNTSGLKVIFFSVYFFVLFSALMVLFNPAYFAIEAMIYNLAMIVCGGLAGYFGLKQNRRFKSDFVQKQDSKHFPPQKKSKNNNKIEDDELLDPKSAQEMINKLKAYLNTKKPYRKSDLSIGELATTLQTNKRTLSWLLNNKMDTNFYGLMNKYRILEAKELLKRFEYRNLKMDELARMAGFKSKSSFNAAFREQTGKTPSAFRKSR